MTIGREKKVNVRLPRPGEDSSCHSVSEPESAPPVLPPACLTNNKNINYNENNKYLFGARKERGETTGIEAEEGVGEM